VIIMEVSGMNVRLLMVFRPLCAGVCGCIIIMATLIALSLGIGEVGLAIRVVLCFHSWEGNRLSFMITRH
jgi:hypothetical protein